MRLVNTYVGYSNHLARTSSFLAALGSLVWLALGLQWLRGIRNVPVLKVLLEVGRAGRDPALSVILAARDEERSLHESVVSMLAQDYPGMLEVIAVNDRSTDHTVEILDELKTRYPDRLRVSNVDSLPGGWLGKTHALYIGAARATGEWLLFTDADVIFSPECSDLAVRYAIDNGLDHLTMPPEILCRSVLLRSFVAALPRTGCGCEGRQLGAKRKGGLASSPTTGSTASPRPLPPTERHASSDPADDHLGTAR